MAAGSATEDCAPNHISLGFDADGFAADLRAARDATKPERTEDERHLIKIQCWASVLGMLGIFLAMRGVISPLAMVLLGYYKYAKFAILAHHSLHGGWGRQRRGWFASTLYRRLIDWLDWIFPLAWTTEHNKVHHYALNEDTDPDFVQRNTSIVHAMKIPLVLKYGLVGFLMFTWKWLYYASNTLKLVHATKPNAPSTKDLEATITLFGLIQYTLKGCPWHRALAIDLFVRVMGPPLLLTFILPPFVAGWLHGSMFCPYTLANLVGAELVTNCHSYCTIVTNHAGSDLWSFSNSCKYGTPEFYLRAVLGSTAFPAGNDIVDFFHGYLNYQPEHHAFPELSPLHYQRLHPRFKAVCHAHRVPYIQEPIWLRTRKTAAIFVGRAKQKHIAGGCINHPEAWMTSEAPLKFQ
mmetsp:Transcript_97229/g.208563  ORF Transcript_97229/g.208563 Transcript_97229/m.208563 type:complete len:408 (-) Transcript_97229:147-1370(-)